MARENDCGVAGDPGRRPGVNEQFKMSETALDQLSRRAREQVFGHILPFWCGLAVDHVQGGWVAWMSNDLRLDRRQPKGLIVNARILWAFSAAYRAKPDPVYRQMAQRAFEFVQTRFWDAERGGVFWRLDDQGQVLDDAKKIYAQAFCIYAMSEYFSAFANPEALSKAIRVFELIEAHAHDDPNGGYIEVCRRDWSEAVGARLSDKDMGEKKSMNNHLHLLEAYTNLVRVWNEPRVERRLRELIAFFETRILDPRTHHLHHFFDERWTVRSDSYTFGHDIEASWLLCEAAEALQDAVLLARVRRVALQMARCVLDEAVEPDGGLCYEGRGGKIIDRGKECWPQAEAAVGFLNAFQISGDSRFLEAAQRSWDYIETHIVDRVNGEWFWRIDESGNVDGSLPKVSEWKGPYHGTRLCLETLRRTKSRTHPRSQPQAARKV
jgi:cellobiose epimerase